MKYLVIIALILTSCSPKILLTNNTKLQIENAGVSLDQVQFYNSSEIVLTRQSSKGELSVTGGKVKIRNGKYFEEIIIPRRTPGICESYDDKAVKVSFEEGSGTLIFLTNREFFKIGAKEWVNNIGKLDYQGKVFNITSGKDSQLMISKSVLTKIDRRKRVVKGNKIGK